MAHTLMYLAPYDYEVDGNRGLQQTRASRRCGFGAGRLANSLTLNFYIRSKVSAHVSVFQFLELPAPELAPAQHTKLAGSAAKLLEDRARREGARRAWKSSSPAICTACHWTTGSI